ncbi:MAG: hypothetical protein RI883_129 [Bacteroidota bacterium]|jgi:hypothetical protein
MGQSKNTTIDLKFRLFLAFLFLAFHAVFSQSFILKGYAIHKDDKPISGAVVYKNKLDTKVLTNNEGIFFLNVTSFDTINIISKESNDYFIVPERSSDTLKYTFVLTTKSYLIDEVVVSSKRVEKISGDYNEYMLDYYVFENGSIAMLKNYKNIHYLTFQNELKEKVDYELPFIPVEFYLDCVGNMHIVGRDSTYQFWIDSTFHIVETLSNNFVETKLKSLVYCGEKEVFSVEYSDYNQKYRLNYNDKETSRTILEVFDTVAYYNIWEQVAKTLGPNSDSTSPVSSDPGSIVRGVPLKYQYLHNSQNTRRFDVQGSAMPISSKKFNDVAFINLQIDKLINIQSFSINDNVISIDILNDKINVYNNKGKEIHKTKMTLTDESKTLVIKDPYSKKFYLSNDLYSPTLEISSLNVQNGEHTAILSLKEARFPEKVKIFNGQLYFIAANENGFQKLYSLHLNLDD